MYPSNRFSSTVKVAVGGRHVWRQRQVRGLGQQRQADAVAASLVGADELERDVLARLADRTAALASRARGERGWLRS